MPVKREFIENGRVVYMVFSDPWRTDEMSVGYNDVIRAYEQSPGKVHSLVDLTHARRIPEGIFRLRSLPGWKHPKSGDVIIFGASAFAEVMIQALKRLLGYGNIHVFKTEAEARAFLAQKLNAPSTPSQEG